jgi:predicted DCC family thiol-disulfide oxidoreductase YuxK
MPFARFRGVEPQRIRREMMRRRACEMRTNSGGDGWLPLATPLILFDGVCNLCNAWVRFVVRHDPTGIFRFAPQQSSIGQAMIEKHFSGSRQLSSVILIRGDTVYTESTAVLDICARLAPPWAWIALILRIVPRPLRDAGYRFVVRHRYRWFGRTDMCQVPSVEMRSRFIE